MCTDCRAYVLLDIGNLCAIEATCTAVQAHMVVGIGRCFSICVFPGSTARMCVVAYVCVCDVLRASIFYFYVFAFADINFRVRVCCIALWSSA